MDYNTFIVYLYVATDKGLILAKKDIYETIYGFIGSADEKFINDEYRLYDYVVAEIRSKKIWNGKKNYRLALRDFTPRRNFEWELTH